MTFFTGWSDHLHGRGPAPTACEQVEAALRRRRAAGVDLGPRATALLRAEVHNRCAMAGRPCPCGRRFPPVRPADLTACRAERAFRRRDRRAVEVHNGGG